MTHLKIGDKVPYFSGNDQDGNRISLDDFRGKKLILFFYPKDDSPGCTKEACTLRDYFSIFQKNGYYLLGVSPDSEKKHKKFIDKYEFQFPLLADPDKKVINDFGLWGPKMFMGKEVIGVHRYTFVIDEQGTITHIFDKVKTSEHAQQIIKALDLN